MRASFAWCTAAWFRHLSPWLQTTMHAHTWYIFRQPHATAFLCSLFRSCVERPASGLVFAAICKGNEDNLHSSLRQRHDDETIVFRSYLSPCSTIAWLQASWFHVSRLMCLVSVCMMGKACICALTGILPMIIVSDISLAYLGDESN